MKDILIITGSVGGRERKGPLVKHAQPSGSHAYRCGADHYDYLAIDDEHKQFEKSGWGNTEPYIPFSNIDRHAQRRNCKLYKVLNTILYPQYKYLVWHDANVSLINDPLEFIEKNQEADIIVAPHRKRRCAYDEIKLVKKIGMDSDGLLGEQGEYYKSQSLPENYGLWHCSTMITKNTPVTKKFQLMWWEQICRYSSRDQISFSFCAYKMKDEIKISSTDFKYEMVSRSWSRPG